MTRFDGTPLSGKTVLVTGASAGIGRATAKVVAEYGADVVLTARREERLEEVSSTITEDYGRETLAVPADVTDETDVAELVDETVETFGSIDVVVNNAGTGTARLTDVEELDTEQYRTVMGVNVDGSFFVTRETLPHLRKSTGTIVFVGSFAGKHPRPESPLYAATKWWTRGFALSLAGQIGDEDVGVSVINPTEVRTEFGKEYRAPEEIAKEKYDPGEVTEPADVAEAIAFAAIQEPPNAVTELDLYRRDKFGEF